MAKYAAFNTQNGDNGTYDITLTNTNASGGCAVTVGTGNPATITVDGVTYNNPARVFYVFKQAIIPGTFVCTQTVENETCPPSLWSWIPASGGAYSYSSNIPEESLGYNQARTFSRISGVVGSILFTPVEPAYHYDTMDDFNRAFEAGEIWPPAEVCYFDVYINGNDKPNIWVNWTVGESISPVTLQPRVWQGVQDLLPIVNEYTTDPDTNLVIPNTGAWYVKKAGDYTYAGAYQSTYLTIQQFFEKYLNAVSKLEHWGFDGDPAFVKLYLQMLRQGVTGNAGIGELYAVTINKDGTASAVAVSGSSDTPGFNTVVRIHYGEPDYVIPSDDATYKKGTNIDGTGDGRYDGSDLPDPTDFTTPIGFDGNAVLTKTYAVSAATLQNIGQKLWSQDYFNVLKIQNNPIENIVSVKHFPFAMTGTAENIKVGDVSFGINGDKVASVQTLTLGSFTYEGHFGNYLDLQPFTSIKINLPYCGIFELNPADLLGSALKVVYHIDLVTGQCMANLKMDENSDGKALPFMTVYGNMGVDIPLTGSDRVQTELRAASAAISAMGSMAGNILGENAIGGGVSGVNGVLTVAGMDYTSQRTASQSPACTSFASPDVYLIIERPMYEIVDNAAMNGYKHLHGYPCNKYLRLSDKKSNGQPLFNEGSFVAMDARTDINISMTADENRMLEELLTKGIYI